MSFCTALISSAAESISVSATPRYPWNGKVDVKFTIIGESGTKYDTSFAATDVAGGTNLTLKTLYKADGAVANPVKESLLPGTYSWVWDAQADLGADTVLERVTVTAETVALGLGGVQLWENGPYWAECNVGATKPEEYGYYFWWGDTKGYKRVGSSWNAVDGSKTDFSFSSGNCPTCNKTGTQLKSAGYTDSSGNLVAKYDAATAHLGALWRMPTDAEWDALISNCTMAWIKTNGVTGRLVTGKGAYASKSIFLPAAGDGDYSSHGSLGSWGYYWSSTPSSGNSYYAWSFYFGSGIFGLIDNRRAGGRSVRPLREFTE